MIYPSARQHGFGSVDVASAAWTSFSFGCQAHRLSSFGFVAVNRSEKQTINSVLRKLASLRAGASFAEAVLQRMVIVTLQNSTGLAMEPVGQIESNSMDRHAGWKPPIRLNDVESSG